MRVRGIDIKYTHTDIENIINGNDKRFKGYFVQKKIIKNISNHQKLILIKSEGVLVSFIIVESEDTVMRFVSSTLCVLVDFYIFLHFCITDVENGKSVEP